MKKIKFIYECERCGAFTEHHKNCDPCLKAIVAEEMGKPQFIQLAQKGGSNENK